jgi:hypothetical protein
VSLEPRTPPPCSAARPCSALSLGWVALRPPAWPASRACPVPGLSRETAARQRPRVAPPRPRAADQAEIAHGQPWCSFREFHPRRQRSLARSTASANRRAPGRRTGNARLSSLRTPLFLSTTAPAGIDTASALGAADGRDYRQWYISTGPLPASAQAATRQPSTRPDRKVWTCTRWFGSRVTATA